MNIKLFKNYLKCIEKGKNINKILLLFIYIIPLLTIFINFKSLEDLVLCVSILAIFVVILHNILLDLVYELRGRFRLKIKNAFSTWLRGNLFLRNKNYILILVSLVFTMFGNLNIVFSINLHIILDSIMFIKFNKKILKNALEKSK